MLPKIIKDRTKKKDAVDPEKEMSFLDHLEELRWHIVRALASIIFFAVLFYLLEDFVFQNIIFAPKHDSFLTYRFFCSLSETTCIQPFDFEIIPRQMGEQFFTSIKVSIWLGFIVSFPYLFWEMWRFIKPGLHDNEQKAARGSVIVCSLLFILGVLFGYYVICPFAIRFLGGYSVGLDVVNSTSLASYVNYMAMFTIPTGIIFELPIVVYFLSKIGLLTPEFMKKYRRHSVIVILILASLITPPDVITQILIGIPIMLLYEVSIWVSARVVKNNLKKA